MNLTLGYQNTKQYNLDFAITPYLFLVKPPLNIYKVYGLGICWGYYSFFIAILFNASKSYPKLKLININQYLKI